MNHGNGFEDIYHIIWFVPNTNSVGEVRNYAGDLMRYRRIGISLRDDRLKRMNRRFLMTEWTATGPKIRVSSAFMAIPRSLREAGIWHEVGHIHHGHRYSEGVPSQTEREDSALITIDRKTLQEMEAAADGFAILHSSKEALKAFLEHLLRARPSAGKGGLNEIEKRELKARIAFVRAY